MDSGGYAPLPDFLILDGGGGSIRFHPILGLIIPLNEGSDSPFKLSDAGCITNHATIRILGIRNIDIEDHHSRLNLLIKPRKELHYQILGLGIGWAHIRAIYLTSDCISKAPIPDEGIEIPLHLDLCLYCHSIQDQSIRSTTYSQGIPLSALPM